MKKLLLVLLSSASILAHAASTDCSPEAQKVVSRLSSHNVTTVAIDYSSDKAEWANTCKTAIEKLNPKINVTMNQVAGTNKFKFAKS